MFDEILEIKPYFFSLRSVGENIILDLKFPISWSIESIIKQRPNVEFSVQDKNDKVKLISLMTAFSKDGYLLLIDLCNQIIKVNLEEELKRRLFNEKMNELKLLFQNKSLDELKDITLIKNEEYTDRDRLIDEGNNDESTRTGDEEEKNDRGDKKSKQRRNT